jgi:hypothetical protein
MTRTERAISGVSPEAASKILRKVHVQEAFLFFTGLGLYTGEFAQSMGEFYEKICIVPSESLEFHLGRGDFEKWIREILGDNVLADRISRIDKSTQGERLRTRMKRTVKRRLNQLRAAKKE